MPLYTCISDSRISDDEREKIALAITDSHCSHTGAPPEFVHVFFNEYLGGNKKTDLRIVGSIRAGRPPDLKAMMHADIVAKVTDILSSSAGRVRLKLQEVPAEWNMEGGEVLPAPGTEADWMRKHWAEDEQAERGPDVSEASPSR
jgi:phenylpyruvate tautomerase PptA (4-oxalocrotonate tautomerase family)